MKHHVVQTVNLSLIIFKMRW